MRVTAHRIETDAYYWQTIKLLNKLKVARNQHTLAVLECNLNTSNGHNEFA